VSDPRYLDYPPLSREEFEERLAQALAELDGPEGDELRALIAWFKRRYPTPLDRLRYATRKHRELARTRGVGLGR
jgi:hypothetical protein